MKLLVNYQDKSYKGSETPNDPYAELHKIQIGNFQEALKICCRWVNYVVSEEFLLEIVILA